MHPAIFRSWVFPGVPRLARIHYVSGRVAFPGGAVVALEGDPAMGGLTTLVFNPNTFLPKGDWRCRVLAVGVGITGCTKSVAGTAAVGAAASVTPSDILWGYAAPVPLFYRQLVIEGTVASALRLDGATQGMKYGPNQQRLYLRDGYLPVAADLFDSAGAGHTVYALANLDLRPELPLVRWDLVAERIDAAGAVVTGQGSAQRRVAIPQVACDCDAQPVPDLFPVVPTFGGFDIRKGEGLAVYVDGAAQTPDIPTTSYAVAHAAVAVWDEGEIRAAERPRGELEVGA